MTSTSEVKALALGFWRRLILTPPVDLSTISECIGIDVYERPFQPGLPGFYLITPAGRAIIALNSAMPRTRIRFTWAHEIGHHLLDNESGAFSQSAAIHLEHPGVERPEPVEGRSERRFRSPMECLCDEFAANLLMPEQLVRRIWGATQSLPLRIRLADTCATFDVSRDAALRRLDELGIAR